jgi:hypothetical protein
MSKHQYCSEAVDDAEIPKHKGRNDAGPALHFLRARRQLLRDILIFAPLFFCLSAVAQDGGVRLP